MEPLGQEAIVPGWGLGRLALELLAQGIDPPELQVDTFQVLSLAQALWWRVGMGAGGGHRAPPLGCDCGTSPFAAGIAGLESILHGPAVPQVVGGHADMVRHRGEPHAIIHVALLCPWEGEWLWPVPLGQWVSRKLDREGRVVREELWQELHIPDQVAQFRGE